MRIIPSENDRFVLVLFDFSFLDEPLLFRPDTLQQSLCGFVRRVLRYQLTLDCLLQNRLFEALWEIHIKLSYSLLRRTIIEQRCGQFMQLIKNALLLHYWR